jgi:hypothetical protein
LDYVWTNSNQNIATAQQDWKYCLHSTAISAHAKRPIQIQGHVSKFTRDVIAAPQQLSINDNATPTPSETPGISIV